MTIREYVFAVAIVIGLCAPALVTVGKAIAEALS